MSVTESFEKAENEYFVLKGKFASGRINREQFEAELKKLMLQDARGRYWVLGTETGKWHVHENGQWVEGDPYGTKILVAAPPPMRPTTLPEQRSAITTAPPATSVQPPPPSVEPSAPPSPPAKKNAGGCLKGCLLILLLLIVIGVGVFLAFRSGAITQAKLLNLAGLGPADIEVDNFRDDAIQVNITRVETVGAGTPTPSPLGLRLNTFDVRSHRVQNPGKYRVEFRTTRGNADLGSCTLTVRGGDQWQFVALPERIAVNRANNPSSKGNDFVIQTSAFCR